MGTGECAQDGLADLGDVAAGGEIHHGVGAVVDGVMQLLQLFVDVGSGDAELPMLALILQLEATPMHIGSSLGDGCWRG